LIEITNLTRRYGDVIAVDSVSLGIERGEVVGLLGHNGAGKTTVMKILTGFLEPSSGRVEVGGIDVTKDRIGVQRQIGYLPENAPLYPEMSVGTYLWMMAELRGLPEAEIEPAVLDAARDTGLEGRLADPIANLSKGYRQRVGIAQAILHRPEVLVLDEPTNGLDPMQIQSIRELIVRLAERTTIILSTHILQEIEAVCDRVLVMIQGSLVEDAPLSSLVSNQGVALSLGSDAPDAAEVCARLESIPGVRAARSVGLDPSVEQARNYSLDCDEAAGAVPAVIEACRDAGWPIVGVAPERRTLEAVFRALQREHVDRLAREEAAA